jgi:HK97 gp10 family phage protein
MTGITSKSLKELNRKLKNISKQFITRSAHKRQEIYNALFEDGNNMRNYIITSMRNTTRAPWSYRKTKDGKRHHPSMPGSFPAVDTGEGIRSIAADVSMKEGVRLEIGVNTGAPYLKFLEEGTKRTDARPWLEPTVQEFKPGIINKLEKIVPTNVVDFFVQGMK